MKKELRLGFAMGGGVSMGAFSGSALTQAIKLALFSAYKHGEYEQVVIDVFSGSSAGSMSLAIMLRGLLGNVPSLKMDQDALNNKLRSEFGNDYGDLPDAQCEHLRWAQYVQDLQAKVWTKQIDIYRLLGKVPGKDPRDLTHCASLLDSRALRDIAEQSLTPKGIDWDNLPSLLSKRVLFGMSLTNLTGMIADSRTELGNEINLEALRDGLRSTVHREMRVFDLSLTKIPSVDNDETKLDTRHGYPESWSRYHNGDPVDLRTGDIRKPYTWGKIIATAMASGAFPIAFEPVPLRRHSWEFPSIDDSLWPAELEKAIEVGWGQDRDPQMLVFRAPNTPGEATPFPFSYIDGGAYNNEPIREAFRMASYMDAQHHKDEDFDRRIIFVDPIVTDKDTTDVSVPLWREVGAPDVSTPARDKIELRPSLDRLFPGIGTLLGAIVNEGRVSEPDRIAQAKRRFEQRSTLRKRLIDSAPQTIEDEKLNELIKWCIQEFEKRQKYDNMPGTALSLERDLQRVVVEEQTNEKPNSPLRNADYSAWEFPAGKKDQWKYGNRAHLIQALYAVVIDLVMDLGGKLTNAKLIAIGPIEYEVTDARLKNPKPLKLQATLLSAFAGFFDEDLRKEAVDAGKYCAHQLMWGSGEINSSIRPKNKPFPKPTAKQVKERNEKIINGSKMLIKRVKQMAKASKRLDLGFNVPVVDSGLSWGIDILLGRLIKRLEKEIDALFFPYPTTRCEVRVKASSGKARLLPSMEGKKEGRRRLMPIELDNDQMFLVTHPEFWLPDGDGPGVMWRGDYVHEGNRLKLANDNFNRIILPGKEITDIAKLLPYPVLEYTLGINEDDPGDWRVLASVIPVEDMLTDKFR